MQFIIFNTCVPVENFIVHFLQSGQKINAAKGSNLLQLAVEAGVHINAACGGEGACGKCRIIIKTGTAECRECSKISDEDYKKGYRQACKTTILSDIDIIIPEESQLDVSSKPKHKTPAHEVRHVTGDIEKLHVFLHQINGTTSLVKKYFIKLTPPTLNDNTSDLSRLMRSLKKEYALETVTMDDTVLKSLPHVLRKSGWEATITVLPEYLEQTNNEDRQGNYPQVKIIRIEPGDTRDIQYALVFDIGTTSIWGQLLDMKTGKVVSESSAYNPQIPYGDDVITRIVYSQKQNGLKKIQQVIVEGLNKIINELVQTSGIQKQYISHFVAAGNTVMTHLLLGMDPKYIREAPYVPVACFVPFLKASIIGFDLDDHTYVYTLPSVASYVGGDIVAGVLSSGMYNDEKLTLYIDIGTNGEIVLGNSEWLMTASCSAGPAFEGGGLKCGMRATTGAIEGFLINDITLEPMIVTIGMKKPKGICGSGAINILAEFMRTGIIDRNGRFNPACSPERIRQGVEGKEYVLAYNEITETQADIVITEADIDNLMRAKAAMFAGCHALLEKAGFTFRNLDRIIIAGAFGDFIDLERAIAIGLMPDVARERYVFIGNGSLFGARCVSFSTELLRDAIVIARKMTNVELSEDHCFMDKYIAGIFLPHTDMNLFPTVSQWLSENSTKAEVKRSL